MLTTATANILEKCYNNSFSINDFRTNQNEIEARN
jgi:hypothetical protein